MSIFSRRNARHTYFRLLKHRGSPKSIGRGAAIGLFVGFLVPFSLQMFVAFPLATLFKAAKIPALIFTWISNPLTIPLLYPLQCYVGSHMIGKPFTFGALKASSDLSIESGTLAHFLQLGAEVALCFLAGGVIFGSVTSIAGYFMTVEAIKRYRNKHEIRKSRQAMTMAER